MSHCNAICISSSNNNQDFWGLYYQENRLHISCQKEHSYPTTNTNTYNVSTFALIVITQGVKCSFALNSHIVYSFRNFRYILNRILRGVLSKWLTKVELKNMHYFMTAHMCLNWVSSSLFAWLVSHTASVLNMLYHYQKQNNQHRNPISVCQTCHELITCV